MHMSGGVGRLHIAMTSPVLAYQKVFSSHSKSLSTDVLNTKHVQGYRTSKMSAEKGIIYFLLILRPS